MMKPCIALALSVLAGGTASGQQVEEVSAVLESSPIVIAHRGASGYLPEHTLESAAYAHALGADYIEQDCVLSRDGVPVVLHDITLESVTNVEEVFPNRRRADGHWVAYDFTLNELLQLHVHERYAGESSPRFPQGKSEFHICTLRQQIELIQGLDHSRRTKTGLYIELKQPARHRKAGLDLASAILDVLRDYNLHEASEQVYLQCFEEDEVQRLRTDLQCRLPLIQLLKHRPSEEKIRAYAEFADGLGVSTNCVLEEVIPGDDPQPRLTDVVATAHQHAMQVHVWTLRKDRLPKGVESAEQYLDWVVHKAGADGIFTDHPDIAVQWRESKSVAGRPGPFHLLKQKKQ